MGMFPISNDNANWDTNVTKELEPVIQSLMDRLEHCCTDEDRRWIQDQAARLIVSAARKGERDPRILTREAAKALRDFLPSHGFLTDQK
jgi:hypothetical protein